MDDAAWNAAMDAHPTCHITIGAYCDWIDEQGRPEAEPYRLMYDRHGCDIPIRGEWFDHVCKHAAWLPADVLYRLFAADPFRGGGGCS